MFVMLHAEQLCSSKRAIRGEGLSEGKKWEKVGKRWIFGKKIILLYTDVLKNIQTNN